MGRPARRKRAAERLVGRRALSEAPERDPLIVRELNTTILVRPDFSIARDRVHAWFILRA